MGGASRSETDRERGGGCERQLIRPRRRNKGQDGVEGMQRKRRRYQSRHQLLFLDHSQRRQPQSEPTVVWAIPNLKAVATKTLSASSLIDPSFDTKTQNNTATAGENAEPRCIPENEKRYGRKTLNSKDESRYIDDSRISVDRPKIRYSNIRIREARFNDRGEYLCQTNTKPILINRIKLLV
ncbi:hypothetical protein DPMN_056008 [Dreissena polymorpha]|uniref:Ig-like domain-containing protein n=1 Tax=Dreissena polymorpha TaxID=45954 RepID=A0A9D4HT81_DREPO|nr:hypothetical protein DPMN_056008 [Dreissena polymorpha]